MPENLKMGPTQHPIHSTLNPKPGSIKKQPRRGKRSISEVRTASLSKPGVWV